MNNMDFLNSINGCKVIDHGKTLDICGLLKGDRKIYRTVMALMFVGGFLCMGISFWLDSGVAGEHSNLFLVYSIISLSIAGTGIMSAWRFSRITEKYVLTVDDDFQEEDAEEIEKYFYLTEGKQEDRMYAYPKEKGGAA